MLVVLLLLPLSLEIDDGELDHRVAVEAVVAWWQQQRWQWQWWLTIGSKSGRQQECGRSHDGMQ
jgi:hypothetical protein